MSDTEKEVVLPLVADDDDDDDVVGGGPDTTDHDVADGGISACEDDGSTSDECRDDLGKREQDEQAEEEEALPMSDISDDEFDPNDGLYNDASFNIAFSRVHDRECQGAMWNEHDMEHFRKWARPRWDESPFAPT